MAYLRTYLLVRLVDRPDDPIEITSDQRDLARWEAHDDWRPDRRHLSARFVAWSALTRNGLYSKPWRHFNDTDCLLVETVAPDDDGGEDEQGLDPGSPAADGSN